VRIQTSGQDPELQRFFVYEGLHRAVGTSKRIGRSSGNRLVDQALNVADANSGSRRWGGWPLQAEFDHGLLIDVPNLRPSPHNIREQWARGL
jgi:hypothetical protein